MRSATPSSKRRAAGGAYNGPSRKPASISPAPARRSQGVVRQVFRFFEFAALDREAVRVYGGVFSDLNVMRYSLSLAVLLLLMAPTAAGQDADHNDRILSWRSYESGHSRQARVRVFQSDDDRRPVTAVIDDHASNGRAPITEEARFVAETVAREFGFPPENASFVFRYTASSFVDEGSDRGRAVLLKVTFRRTASGGLGSASWRVLTSDGLEDLTDRAMR